MLTDNEYATATVVNALFEKLTFINPAFKQAWPTQREFEGAKVEWTLAFIQKGITSLDQIRRGLESYRLNPSPFVPSPGQFLELCIPTAADIGAPSVELAFQEASEQAHPQSWKKTWSHPAVHHAYKLTGPQSFLSDGASRVFDKFSQHYRQAILDYAAGKIMDQLPAPKPHASRTDEDKPETIGKYEFVRPGILKQYQHVKGPEEAFAIIDKLLGKGDGKLRALVDRMQAQYDSTYGQRTKETEDNTGQGSAS